MYCKNCGTQMEENAKFCPSCGSQNEQAQQSQPQVVQTERLQPPAGLFRMTTTWAVLLLIGSCCNFFYGVPSLILAIVGLVQISGANAFFDTGNYAMAEHKYKNIKIILWIGLGLLLAALVLNIFITVPAFMEAYRQALEEYPY